MGQAWAVSKARALVSIVLGLCAFGSVGSDASAEPALVTGADYHAVVGERFATASCALKIQLREKGWQSVPLVSSAIPLKSSAVHGRKGYVERAAGRYTAHLLGRDNYTVELTFLLEVERRGVERAVRLPLVPATSTRVEFELEGTDWVVRTAAEVPLKVTEEGGRTLVRLYPADLDALTLKWLPTEIERPPAAVFEASESTLVLLRPGAAERRTRLSIQLRRGEVDSLSIELPTGLDVREVSSCGGAPSLRSWRVEETDRARRLQVHLAEPASEAFAVSVVSEELTPAAGQPVMLSLLKVRGATRQEGRLEVAAPEAFRVVDAGSAAIRATLSEERAEADGGGSVFIRRLAFQYHSLPAELRVRLIPRTAQLMATTTSFVHIGAGVVDMEMRIAYEIARRSVDQFRVQLDEGLMVLAVRGKDIDVWDVEEGVLEVRLRRPVEERYELSLQCVQHLRRVDGVLVPQVLCLETERQSGSLGISAGDDVALVHHHSRGFIQVDVETLPPWLRGRGPKLGYTYGQPGGLLAVATSLIRPAVQVEGFASASVVADAVSEEYLYVVDVERQPVFGFRLRVPEGLIPINLLGEHVADWEFDAPRRLISVSLTEGITGSTRLHLFCERRLDSEQAEIPLGGAALLDAEHSAGWLGVATHENFDLLPVVEESLVAADVQDAPPVVSAVPGLRLAYRWSGEHWGLTCRTRAIAPRIVARTRTALLFGGGRVLARTDADCAVTRARLQELLVRLPPGTPDSEVDGPGIQSRELTDDLWRLRLAEPVSDDYRFRVTYELLPGPDGVLRHTGIVLPQAYRQTGTVSVYLADPQLEVTVGQLEGAEGAAPADGPPGPTFDEGTFLRAFSYRDAERSIEFHLEGLQMARGVQLRGERVQIATVMKSEGQAVSYMNCRVRNAGEQFLRLALPQGALLWGAYVDGRPVGASELSGGRILVPLLEAPAGRPFEVGVIWAEPGEKMGLGTSFALQAPQLDLPAEGVGWDIYLPRDYEVLQAGGNMEMLRRQPWHRQGLPGVAARYAGAAWRVVRGFAERAWTVARVIGIAGALLLALAAGSGAAVAVFWALARHRRARRARRAAAGREAPVRSPILVFFELLLIGAFLLILVAMLMPALGGARGEARKASSLGNLKDIALAIAVYQKDHDGQLPPTLEDLSDYLGGSFFGLLESPHTGERYVYAGPLEPGEFGPTTPLVWERPLPELDGIAVLFGDGSVRYVPLEERTAMTATGELEAIDFIRKLEDTGRVARRGDWPGEAGGPTSVDAFLMAQEAAPPVLGHKLGGEPEQIGVLDEEEAVPADQDLDGDLSVVGTVSAYMHARGARKTERDEEARRLLSYQRAVQLAEAHRKQGELGRAGRAYNEALRHAPEGREAQEGLRRLEELSGLADGKRLAGRPPEGEREETATYDVASALTLAEKLRAEDVADWEGTVEQEAGGKPVLDVLTGKAESAQTIGGGTVTLRGSELVIQGTPEEVERLKADAAAVRGEMLEMVREVTEQRQREQAERAAKRRAELRRRQALQKAAPTAGRGTISGNRAAGALPLELSFPTFGTLAYPFRMDYAGTSQPRIELLCVRAGAAMVLQGALALVLLVAAAAAAWRWPRVGPIIWVALAVLLAFALATGGEASRPYTVMALTGLCLAAPWVLTRLALRLRRSEDDNTSAAHAARER